MTWYERIIAAHVAVTDAVSHCQRLKSDRYFVWQEDGQTSLMANGKHTEKAITGTTDLFTKQEFDPWKQEFENALDLDDCICWRLKSVQFEEDTGFYHYEWAWEVIGDG